MSVIRVGRTLAPATAGVSIEEAPAAFLRTSTTPAQVSVLPPTASAVGGAAAERRAIVGGYALFGVGILITGIAALVTVIPDGRPGTAFDVFALLYIFAQSIERLIEPISRFVAGTGTGADGKERSNKDEAKDKRATAINAALEATDAASKKQAVDEAAAAQKAIDQARANAVYWMWGVATLLGILAAAAFGVRMLAAVGVAAPLPILDVWVTGVIIGSGTKPLHDLVERIRLPKEEKDQETDA